jgi:hypothetical protein
MSDIRGIHYEISKPKLNMKVMSLPRKVDYFIAVFATAFCLVTVSAANATMTCTWLDEFPVISDPSIQQKLEAHVRALPGLKNYKIRLLQGRYFLVQAEGKFCKDVPHCEYRLLELRDGVVRNIFAFEGTGMIWREWSPLSFRVENLEDDYSAWAFETTEDTYIRVDLPRFRDMVVIGSPGPLAMPTLRACDGIKKSAR